MSMTTRRNSSIAQLIAAGELVGSILLLAGCSSLVSRPDESGQVQGRVANNVDVAKLLSGEQVLLVEPVEIDSDVRATIIRQAAQKNVSPQETEGILTQLATKAEQSIYNIASSRAAGVIIHDDPVERQAKATIRIHCTIKSLELVSADGNVGGMWAAISGKGRVKSERFNSTVELRASKDGQRVASGVGLGQCDYKTQQEDSMAAVRVTTAKPNEASAAADDDKMSRTHNVELTLNSPAARCVELGIEYAWNEMWASLELKVAGERSSAKPVGK